MKPIFATEAELAEEKTLPLLTVLVDTEVVWCTPWLFQRNAWQFGGGFEFRRSSVLFVRFQVIMVALRTEGELHSDSEIERRIESTYTRNGPSSMSWAQDRAVVAIVTSAMHA